MPPETIARTTITPATIAIDWGTTNFRAFLLDQEGAPLASLASEQGLLSVPAGGFEEVLLQAIAPWLEDYGQLPVTMAGMVGARGGWREAGYLDCPASLEKLVAGLVRIPNRAGLDIRVVPGLADRSRPAGDVMRGEETLLLGFLEGEPDYQGPIILPGTHSKLAILQDGAVVTFLTAMTGEVFQLLARHSILAQSLPDEANRNALPKSEAFQLGLQRGAEAQILQQLFSVRTQALLHEWPPGDSASYLSGLLIAAELTGYGPDLWSQGSAVPLVGAAPLCALYASALEARGRSAKLLSAEELFLAGIGRLGRMMKEGQG